MAISVSIDAGWLKAVSGHQNGKNFYVDACAKVRLNGEVENGKIKSEENLQLKIAELKSALSVSGKEVDLVFCSGSVLSKIVEVPPLKERQLMNIVKEELAEFIGDEEAYVYDYYVIDDCNEQGMGKILCVGMEKSVVEGFRQCFSKAQWKLKSFDVAQSAQYKLLDFTPSLLEKTFILGSLNGKRFEATLYNKGEYLQSSRTQLSQRDTIGIVPEVSQMLSSMVQFNKSLRTGNEIETIYLCGMTEAEQAFCGNISNSVGIMADILSDQMVNVSHSLAEYSVSEYAYATGNLARR